MGSGSNSGSNSGRRRLSLRGMHSGGTLTVHQVGLHGGAHAVEGVLAGGVEVVLQQLQLAASNHTAVRPGREVDLRTKSHHQPATGSPGRTPILRSVLPMQLPWHLGLQIAAPPA